MSTLLFVVAIFLLLTTGVAEEVRLVGGPSPREERLEVYYSSTWGTVCDSGFMDVSARVVCYMLGYGFCGHAVGNRYGAGSGTIWLDYVRCRNTDRRIAHCRHIGWGRHYCTHRNDVSVSCFCDVRVVGDSGLGGRLEVFHRGTWGTVCASGFTDEVAVVVCNMLGYGHPWNARILNKTRGAAGGGPIWLANVQCSGRESHIAECRHGGWGQSNCSHADDVSISCVSRSVEAVALLGGGNLRAGRLELFHGSQWGTVCGDGFTDAAAAVVCYSLGFGRVGRAVDISLYGEGGGLIWLSDINCTGTERYIGECSHGDWGAHSCGHRQDVAVSCADNTSTADDRDLNDSTSPVTPVRLVGGTASRGRLEVLHSGAWGTVCGRSFTAVEARVVCVMLGYDWGTKINNSNYTTSDGPIWLDNVRCNGTETDIANCSHNGWAVHNCQHREDAAISCARIQVRLNGNLDSRYGKLEVFYNGIWGFVCDKDVAMGYAEATVICNMLGFAHVGSRPSYWFDLLRGPVWLSSVQCTGLEKSIAQCAYNGWGVNYRDSCRIAGTRVRRVAISCLPNDAVGLFGGGSPREGRLEVHHNFHWGAVCADGFTDAAARVACYSLGFGYSGRRVDTSLYGFGQASSTTIWLGDVHCNGTERHIGLCSHGPWGVYNCTHRSLAAVSCFGDPSPGSTSPSYKPPVSSAITTPSPTSVPGHASTQGIGRRRVSLVTTVASVVAGLLLIVCVAVAVVAVHYRRRWRRDRTDEATLAASTVTYCNDAFDDGRSHSDAACTD